MARARLACAAAACAALFACHARTPRTTATARAESTGAGEREAFLEMFARSYVPGRSGQIFVVPEEGDFLLSRPDDLYRFMHGGPWDYDASIPLLFHGQPFVREGRFQEPAAQQDVAPTLARLLGLPVPSTMTGRVLHSALSDSEARPSAVLLAVLDGMRGDSLDRFAEKLVTLNGLRAEGAWFPNARVNYLPSVTSAGHATVATGTDPRFHGIHGNSLFDRRTGRSEGPFPGLNPATYRALTLADYWNLATSGQARILVQGTTPRATVSLAGHGGCTENARPYPMAMFDERTAGWVTNPDCYRLPAYLEDDDASTVWEWAGRTWMEHPVEDGRALLRTALFPGFQTDALIEMIEKEGVGKDEVPDLIVASFKTPDYVSHQYGPESEETAAALAALDEELGRLLDRLESAAGPHRSVVVVTSDHGMPSEPPEGRERRYVEDIVQEIHQRFDPGGRLILDFSDPANLQIYVDRERLEELGLSLSQVAAFLEELPFLRFAFTEEEVRAAPVPARAPVPAQRIREASSFTSERDQAFWNRSLAIAASSVFPWASRAFTSP